MKSIRTILFPTDFSDPCGHAWKHALLHAGKHKARVVIVHVIHRMPETHQFLMMAMAPAQTTDSLADWARRKIVRLKKEAERIGLRCDTMIREGNPFVQIIRCAREVRSDMIIMGSHGRTGLAQALIGSVAERVVRKAHCSVLVVKYPLQRFRMP